MLFVYWFLLPLRFVWLLVCCLYKEVYLQICKCVSFWLRGCCGEWESWPVNRLTTQIEWMLSVAIRLTVLSRYRNRRLIGLQFKKKKTFWLNRNAIFSLSSNAVLPLEIPFNMFKCYMFETLMSLYSYIRKFLSSITQLLRWVRRWAL